MILHVDIKDNAYDVVIERGILKKADEVLNLNRKVLVVTDKGVPKEYSETICKLSKNAVLAVIEGGEDSKSLDSFAYLQTLMLENNFSRKDCVVAVGGGVVGDLAGFAASAYMRGIDFYNIPTTVLSMVDSSIGGKTAINFGGVKNIVGAFYQPKKVLVDIDVCKTLSDRLVSNGLSEAFKMAATFDEELFKLFESDAYMDKLEDIIAKSLDTKRKVVEEDEKEAGLRKVLNFGHTIGHGIEVTSDGKLLHGESVALGMLMMASPEAKKRLKAVNERLNLPTSFDINVEEALKAISHDKKSGANGISVVWVENIGSFELKNFTLDDIRAQIDEFLKGN